MPINLKKILELVDDVKEMATALEKAREIIKYTTHHMDVEAVETWLAHYGEDRDDD